MTTKAETLAADKLAQVLAEHYEWHYAAGSECKRIACYGCAEEVEVPDLTNLTDDDADAAASRTFHAHVAAVVLAHLTAEGWAPPLDDVTLPRLPSRVVRRRVTDWEPADA